METVFRTDDLPAAERFPFYLELLSQTLAPHEIRTEHAAGFLARLRTVQLGALQLTALAQQALEGYRTPKLIRQSDPECYHFGVNVQGRVLMEQNGRSGVVAPGDLVVYDTSHPFHTITDPGNLLGSGLTLTVPRALVPLPENKIAGLLVTPLPGRNGIGELLSGYLLQLIKNTGRYRPSDTARLGSVVLDLITALFAHLLEADDAIPPETRHQPLLIHVHAFIDQHLTDPALSPETIAAAHHLSIRSLQRLFHTQGVTVAAWIRTRRLDRCRRDLADPLLRTQSIQAIAARWGFPFSFYSTTGAAGC